MSNPLADYLSAIEARDAQEQAHATYIDAYTKLADRTAALAKATSEAPQPDVSTSQSQSTGRSAHPSTPKGKSSPAPEPPTVAQIRAELASTQTHRVALEARLSSTTTDLEALKLSHSTQSKKVQQLEKVRDHLERRLRDRAEELKTKGTFSQDIQDEMVALQLELSMAEQERDKFKKENEELTRRWMERMEQEAQRQNERLENEWNSTRRT